LSLRLCVVLGAASLVSCSAANSPKIVAGDATTVSIVAGWFAPEAVAQSHCESFGKRAIFQSSAEVRPGSQRIIHYFNCDDPITE
jgi:hypothetical protein